MPLRQRGVIADGWLILIGAIAILGLLYALIQWADNHIATDAGIKRGEANIQAKWDAANREAQEKADAERRKNAAIVAAEQAKARDAEKVAADYELKWRQEREKSRGKPLTATVCPPVIPGEPSQPAIPDTRFTWRFVGLWDAAWTGKDGKPLFGDPASRAPAGASPDAPSPYGAEQAIDNHAQNAARWDVCRRSLNSLMDTIERLQSGK